MPENPNPPIEFDAVLGGQSPPVDATILGGIEGLRRRFSASNTEQRINLLSDALKYVDKGVDLLVEAMNDEALIVRANAYQLLQGLSATKAQQAIAKGVVLNPGDRVYKVYQSGMFYHEDDRGYNILDNIMKLCKEDRDNYAAKLISRHLFRDRAETKAKLLHQWRILEFNVYKLAGRYPNHFDIKEWCAVNKVPLICQSDEWEFECKVLRYLQNSKNVELLGQLWELLGIPRLAFVHQEIVKKKASFNPK